MAGLDLLGEIAQTGAQYDAHLGAEIGGLLFDPGRSLLNFL